jgi:hypothetical protein
LWERQLTCVASDSASFSHTNFVLHHSSFSFAFVPPSFLCQAHSIIVNGLLLGISPSQGQPKGSLSMLISHLLSNFHFYLLGNKQHLFHCKNIQINNNKPEGKPWALITLLSIFSFSKFIISVAGYCTTAKQEVTSDYNLMALLTLYN